MPLIEDMATAAFFTKEKKTQCEKPQNYNSTSRMTKSGAKKPLRQSVKLKMLEFELYFLDNKLDGSGFCAQI